MTDELVIRARHAFKYVTSGSASIKHIEAKNSVDMAVITPLAN